MPAKKPNNLLRKTIMKKFILTLTISFLAAPSISLAMNLATTDVATVEPTPTKRAATPRTDRKAQPHSIPAREAYDFANLINGEKYDKVFNTILLPKPLRSYGPALVLRNIIDGKITQESPLTCKETWKSYTLPGIEKDKFLQCCIHIANSLEQSYEDDERTAVNYFLIKKHLEHLPSAQLLCPERSLFTFINNKKYSEAVKFIGKIKNESDNEIVNILKQIISYKITKSSPFSTIKNWQSYKPSHGVNKKELLATALFIAKERIIYYQKRNRANRVSVYKNLQQHLLSLEKV